MAEHITTIEKSMKEIVRLAADKAADGNQAVRWVLNKDKHADSLGEIATCYFMAQRVAPVEKTDAKYHEKYVMEISLLHQVLHHAMKAKQTTGLKETEKLRGLLKLFRESYQNEGADK